MRPRSLYGYLLLGLALVLVPPLIVAAVGISAQQRELTASREAARAATTRVALAAHLQVTVEVAEDVARRARFLPDRAVAQRIRAALVAARSDLDALHELHGSGAKEVEPEFAAVARPVARLDTPRADLARRHGRAQPPRYRERAAHR